MQQHPKAGPEAFWTSLSWNVIVNEQSRLHFVVGSLDKIIGIGKFSAKEFVTCKADKAGVRRVSVLCHGVCLYTILFCAVIIFYDAHENRRLQFEN